MRVGLAKAADVFESIAKMTAHRLVTTFLLLALLQAVHGFGHVPNSPCSSLCSGNPQNTLKNDVVCLDEDFYNSTDGNAFRHCMACELNSTAVDTANNQSDVDWGLCMLCEVPALRINADKICNSQFEIYCIRMSLRMAGAANQHL